MRYDADKVARLPKWAQDHIAILTRQLAEAEAVNARHGDLSQTNTTVKSAHDYMVDEYLPPNSCVTFTLANGRKVSASVDRQGRLAVNADATVAVFHQASNCFTLAVER